MGLQLSVQVKMKLMYALAQQLSEKSLEEDIFHNKAWMAWMVFRCFILFPFPLKYRSRFPSVSFPQKRQQNSDCEGRLNIGGFSGGVDQ